MIKDEFTKDFLRLPHKQVRIILATGAEHRHAPRHVLELLQPRLSRGTRLRRKPLEQGRPDYIYNDGTNYHRLGLFVPYCEHGSWNIRVQTAGKCQVSQ
jgi:hypothetical protein